MTPVAALGLFGASFFFLSPHFLLTAMALAFKLLTPARAALMRRTLATSAARLHVRGVGMHMRARAGLMG
jgi:hypothetical protein